MFFEYIYYIYNVMLSRQCWKLVIINSVRQCCFYFYTIYNICITNIYWNCQYLINLLKYYVFKLTEKNISRQTFKQKVFFNLLLLLLKLMGMYYS